MLTYNEAKALFKTARRGYAGKPLPGREGRTRLFERSDGYAIRYTKTDVVTIHRNGSYTLRSGGWATKTTRERINTYAPCRVFTYLGHQFVAPLRNARTWGTGLVWPFKDGMRINAKGRPIGSGKGKPWGTVMVTVRREAGKRYRAERKELLARRQRHFNEAVTAAVTLGHRISVNDERGKALINAQRHWNPGVTCDACGSWINLSCRTSLACGSRDDKPEYDRVIVNAPAFGVIQGGAALSRSSKASLTLITGGK